MKIKEVGKQRKPNTGRQNNFEKSCNVETRNRYYLVVKLLRAHEGCLGIGRRRRTCKAAKSLGELHKSFDPGISEWSNPAEVMFCYLQLNP